MKRTTISILAAVVLMGAGCGDDDGTSVQQDAAQPDVMVNLCGNNFVDPGEACDDGNRINGDGCSIDCEWEAVCGDDVAMAPEECDGSDGLPTCVQLGYLDGTTTCNSSCEVVDGDCTDDASDLVAWYKLDGASGVVVDSTFSGNGCTVVGDVQRGYEGYIDEAFLFNGTDAYADCGVGSFMDGMAGLTLEVWVNVTGYTPDGVFIGRADAVDASGLSYVIGIAGGTHWGSDQYSVFFGAHDPMTVVHSDGMFMTGEWHHVAGVYQAGLLTIYVDGEEAGTRAQSETGPIRDSTGARTHIGHLHDSGSASSWDTFYEGYLDDIKVWRVARTREQVCADAGGSPDGQGNCDITDL